MGESTATKSNSPTKDKAMTIRALEKIVKGQGEAIMALKGIIDSNAYGDRLAAIEKSITEAISIPAQMVEPEGVDRIANLEACLAKMAHYTGAQKVLDEFGIARWEITKESMGKRKG